MADFNYKTFVKTLTNTFHFHFQKFSCMTINIGVAQGSILGPLLFLLYIPDLAFCVTEFYTILFADHTSLSLAGNDYTQ